MFPIDLSNSNEPIFLCSWNYDEIVELHTKQSLKAKYGATNLYDDEEFCYSFPHLNMTFEEFLDYLSKGSHYHLDNMTVERIN